MAFKSYAKGGNYGSYNVLPIGTEINEDLRIANEKVQNIQLTAQAKANHAQEYISALNNKFDVEQQNRDQNNQWFKENHKRIYKGEQREFEGEMAELKRRHAEEARKEAEPSVLEKALPHILSLVTIGAGMVAETAAAEKAAGVAKAADTGQQLSNANLNPNFNTPEFQALPPEVRNQQMYDMAAKTAEVHSWTPEQQETFLGELKNSLNYKGEQLEAFQQAAINRASRNAQHITLTNPKNDSSMHSSMAAYTENFTTQYTREFYNQLGGGPAGSGKGVAAGQKYYNGVSERVKSANRQSTSKFINSQRNAALKTQMQIGLKEYNLSIHTDVLHSVNGTGPFTGPADQGPTQNLFTTLKQLKDVDANGNWGIALDLFGTAVANEAQVSYQMLEEVKGLVLADAASGLPEGVAKRKNRVERAFATIIGNKKDLEVETRKKHNNYRRVQGQRVIDQVESLESQSEQKAFIEGLGDDIKTLPADVQKHLLRIQTGQPSVAKAQAKKYSSYFPKQAVKERVETEMTKLILDKYPDVKEVNISTWELQKVINDTMRLLPGEIGIDDSGFRENPENAFNAALTKALDGHDWSIEKTGLTANVGVTGKRTNQPQEVLETNLGKVDLTNSKPQLREIFLANKGYLQEFRNYGDQINRWYENNPGQEMSYTDLASSPMLNSHMVTSFIEASNDITLSRSNAFRLLLEAASDGKAPDISSAVIKRPQVAAARTAGFNARPESTVGMGVYGGTTSITPSSYSPQPAQYTGDRDRQETGTDVVFEGGVNAPLVLEIPARVGEPEDGFPAVFTEPDTGAKSFGHTVSVIVTLPNGNEVDFFIGHLHEPSPLAGFKGNIPAGTRLGGQGMSGSTSGDPVATMHANGRNGYKATPEDLMWIVRNMRGISGGTN